MRDVNDVVRRDTDQILIESSMMNGAEAQTIGDAGFAEVIRVANNVCRIEEPQFLQSANSALTAVSRDDLGAEPGLMKADSSLANGVTPFDWIL